MHLPRSLTRRTCRTRGTQPTRPALVMACTAVLLAGASPATWAQGKHQHGVSQLDLSVERQRLSLRLVSPLDNFVGFERAPRTDAEKTAIDKVLARLRAPADLVQVDGAAGCTLAASRIESPVLGLSPGGTALAATGTAGTAGTAGARKAAQDEHADLVLEVDFDCRDGSRVGFVQLALFEAFPRMRRIEVQAVTLRGQLGAVLARPNGRIALVR